MLVFLLILLINLINIGIRLATIGYFVVSNKTLNKIEKAMNELTEIKSAIQDKAVRSYREFPEMWEYQFAITSEKVAKEFVKNLDNDQRQLLEEKSVKESDLVEWVKEAIK